MKRVVFIMAIFVFILSAVAVSHAGVAGSLHDFSSGSAQFMYDTGNVCVFCHTPHMANSNISVLWNRALPSPAAYQLYNTSTFNGVQDLTVSRYSLMCLGCHDGVTAINAIINNPSDGDVSGGTNLLAPGTDTIGDLGINNRVNTLESSGDLRNDHPIGFIYDDALVDADKAAKGIPGDELVRPGAVQAGYVGPVADNIKLFGPNRDRLECSTCHDPHDDTAAVTPFLTKTNVGSALCLSCHIK